VREDRDTPAFAEKLQSERKKGKENRDHFVASFRETLIGILDRVDEWRKMEKLSFHSTICARRESENGTKQAEVYKCVWLSLVCRFV